MQVKQIAQVSYKHLVKLVGYSEDSHQQFLVYDYISNGNVGNLLYGNNSIFLYIYIQITIVPVLVNPKVLCPSSFFQIPKVHLPEN